MNSATNNLPPLTFKNEHASVVLMPIAGEYVVSAYYLNGRGEPDYDCEICFKQFRNVALALAEFKDQRKSIEAAEAAGTLETAKVLAGKVATLRNEGISLTFDL